MALTAHLIDTHWEKHNFNLACSHFPGTHTAPDVVRKITEILADYGIPHESITAMVMDNEPTSNAAGDLMPYDWLGCLAHLLELTVGAAFNAPHVVGAVDRLRAQVGWFNHSSQGEAALKNMQKALNPTERPLGVVQDVKTRWWTLEASAGRHVKLKAAIVALQSTGQFKFPPLLEQDWDILQVLLLVLRPIMKVTIDSLFALRVSVRHCSLLKTAAFLSILCSPSSS